MYFFFLLNEYNDNKSIPLQHSSKTTSYEITCDKLYNRSVIELGEKSGWYVYMFN